MDNQAFDENLEIRVSVLEAKVERLSVAMENFQIFVHGKFADLSATIDSMIDSKFSTGIVKLQRDLGIPSVKKEDDRSDNSKSVAKSPIFEAKSSRSNEKNRQESFAEDQNSAEKEESKLEEESYQKPAVDDLGCKQFVKMISLVPGGFLVLLLSSLSCAHKLFVKMSKQGLCSWSFVELYLGMISITRIFYGTNGFPFDPGIPAADHGCEYIAAAYASFFRTYR